MAPMNKRRKLASGQVEDLTFDPAARQEYLSGFHKRKQARIRHARDLAVKRDREERVKERRQLRENRKDELQLHIEAVNAELKRQNRLVDGRSEDHTSEDEEDTDEPGLATRGNDTIESNEQFEQEEEYVDEDKHTTVTVEPMGDLDSEPNTGGEDDPENKEQNPSTEIAAKATKRSKWARSVSHDGTGSKVKKKKFRYESKAERIATRKKQKSRNQMAKARREGK